MSDADLTLSLGELWRAAMAAADPLRALAAARELRSLLYDWEAHLARQASEEGESWEAIGRTLGVSRQAAWARFREEQPTPAIREARGRLADARRRAAAPTEVDDTG